MAIVKANTLPNVGELIRGLDLAQPLGIIKTSDGKAWDCELPLDEAAYWFDIVTKAERFNSTGPEAFLNASKESWVSRYVQCYTVVEMQQVEFDPDIPTSRMDVYTWLKGQALAQPYLEENLEGFLATLLKTRLELVDRWTKEAEAFLHDTPMLEQEIDALEEPVVEQMYRTANNLLATSPKATLEDFESPLALIKFLGSCAKEIATAVGVDMEDPGIGTGLLAGEHSLDVSQTFSKFDRELTYLRTMLDDAAMKDRRHIEEATRHFRSLQTLRPCLAGSLKDREQFLQDRKRGIQLRSFRNQRGLTLQELAEIMVDGADLVGPELRVLEEQKAERERAIKARVTLLSRLETGAMQRGGFKRDIEEAICSALKCTSRELNQTPIGYHLHGADLHQIDFRLRQDKKTQKLYMEHGFTKVGRSLSQDPSEWPEVFKKPNSRSQFSAFYMPPINGEPLSEGEKIDLLRAAIQYHQPHSIKALEAMGRNPTVVTPLTQNDIGETAEKNVEKVLWAEIKEGLPLFDYVTTSIDAGTEYTETGYAWNQEWFRISTHMVTPAPVLINPSSSIPDEVARTIHPSNFPTNMNKNLPVLGFARGGDYEMQFFDNGDALEHIETPPVLNNIRDAFAVIVSNDSMSPRYEPGDYLYCDPDRVPGKEDYVVVAMTDQRCIVKRFLRQTPDAIYLEQLNPDEKLTIKREELQRLYVVVGTKTKK